MKKEELNIILDDHRKWVNDEDGGQRANLRDANLSGANLSGANLWGANLWGANLRDANLWGANLRDANLRDANLSGANLWGANLWDANLSGANLWGANLSGANLWGANLWDANLSGANLSGASGNLKEIKSIFLDTYPVTYSAEVLQIGCERHKIEEWWSFDDERIIKMDGKEALKFWRKYKDFIKQAIELSPALETNYKGDK